MFTAQKRYGLNPSIVTKTKTWSDPFKWQLIAKAGGKHELVFTCSWSDWFHEKADSWRDEAWAVIRACPNLIFQILTKRPERVADCLPADWSSGYENVWIGVSIENEDYAWRADVLREIPAQIRFISAEPLLGPIPNLNLDGIHWLIVGGESGPGFRHMQEDWARDLRDRARIANVAFFFKQSSALRTEMGTTLDGQEWRQYPLASRIEPAYEL